MELKPFSLGEFVIANPLLLAPMVGVSDSPFREICAANGAGLTVAEMLPSNPDRWSSKKNRSRQVKPQLAGPQVIQIAGSDPGMMAQAAILNVAMGADVIDINMGCPAKKVLRKAAGSALLQDPALVERILRAVVAAVDVPVTLKTRTGWCRQSRNGVEIAKLAEQAGIQMLTIHGRTRACRFNGHAEYDTIARIKHSVSIPVIANGDITSPQKASQVLQATGADGLMVGRGAHGQPWLFRAMRHYLETGQHLPAPAPTQVQQTIESHLEKIYGLYGDRKGVLFARKHMRWYSNRLADGTQDQFPGIQEFWQRFSQKQTRWEQTEALTAYFDALTNPSAREIAA